MSVLERCPFYRDHHDDVTLKTSLTVLKCHVHTHAPKSIYNKNLYSMEALSYGRTKPELQRNAAPKK